MAATPVSVSGTITITRETKSDIYQMLETNGSWRPVDYTIEDFNP